MHVFQLQFMLATRNFAKASEQKGMQRTLEKEKQDETKCIVRTLLMGKLLEEKLFLCNSESVSIVITTKFNDHDSIHALFHRNT
jgi:hypothetical protein